MCATVREHTRQLARAQAAQQAIGEGDRCLLLPDPVAKALTTALAHSAAPAWRVNRHRRAARATGPTSRGFVAGQGRTRYRRKTQRRRGYRFQQQRTRNGKQREFSTGSLPKWQSPAAARDPDRVRTNSPVCRRLSQRCCKSARCADHSDDDGSCSEVRRRGRRACAAASGGRTQSQRGACQRGLSLGSLRRSRGSRTCGRVRSPRSGPPSDLDDAVLTQRHAHDGMLEPIAIKSVAISAEHALEYLVV